MFATIPPELIGTISTFVRPRDLLSFALVDRTCNLYATQRLYYTIILSHLEYIRALSCIRTLASPPDTHAFGRDLAALIHHFEIGYAETFMSPCIKADILEHGLQTPTAGSSRQLLASMTNLRSLKITSNYDILGTSHHLLLLLEVVTTPHKHLSSIDINFSSTFPLPDEPFLELQTRTMFRQLTPSLQHIHLDLPRNPPMPIARFFEEIFLSFSEDILTVSLDRTGWRDWDNIAMFLDNDISFLELHKVTLHPKGHSLPYVRLFDHARALHLLRMSFWPGVEDWSDNDDTESDGSDASDDETDSEENSGPSHSDDGDEERDGLDEGYAEEDRDIEGNEALAPAANQEVQDGDPDQHVVRGGHDEEDARDSEDDDSDSDEEDDIIAPQRGIRVPPGAWANLEEISCATRDLPSFLPRETYPSERRPICSVRISNVDYDPSSEGLCDTTDAPSWPDLLKILSHLHYSAVPIRELRFLVKTLDISSLASLVVQHPHLETLVIATDFGKTPTKDDLFALGVQVFAHAPTLHTFLLSDDVFRFFVRAPYEFARDIPLQRSLLAEYDKHAPGLRRVAFTLECEWEKGVDGWWYHIEGEDPIVWRRRAALQDAHAVHEYYKHDGTPLRHPIDYDGPPNRLPGCDKCYADVYFSDDE